MKHKRRRKWVRKNKRMKGRSIEERPAVVDDGNDLAQLQERYGAEYFSQIFKTMTADNGPEFENLLQFENLGTKIYFTHPYSSWERAQNERHNGLLRDFIPKGMSMERFSDEDILNMADTLNQRPRRVLGYHTPSELFDAFLDEVYASECVS